MKRNWILIVLSILGVAGFVLNRTVGDMPGKAHASETAVGECVLPDEDTASDAERRYMSNQPHHWRYVMLKRN